MHDKGYVEYSFIIGAVWPLSLILTIVGAGFVGIILLFGFAMECLEVIATKIAKKLKISIKYDTTDENEQETRIEQDKENIDEGITK